MTFLGAEIASEKHIQFEQPDSGSLLIKVTSDGTVSEARSLHKEQEDFWCEDGRLWVSDVDRTTSVWAVARGRDNTGFSRADDGSLVAEFDSRGGGLVFLIPAYASVTSHFRWEAVD